MLKYSFRIFLLFLTLTTSIFSDSGYVIDNYRVNIDIDEKNIYKVEESIDVNFKEPRRGIFRIIPEKFNGREIKVSDVKTNVKTHAKDEGDYIYLRLGDPEVYLTGAKNYIIKFKHNLGWDRLPKYDEVYYNLIGNDWDTEIKRLEFSIKLPKEFDASRVNFTSGVRGSTSNKDVKWSVDGNIIKGYTLKPLNPNESVTVALPLPEGYFNNGKEKFIFNVLKGLLYLTYFAVPLGAILLWRKFRDDSNIVQTVEFYSPDNLTPTEVGYYVDGSVDSKDLTSLIFYWANSGYLKINEKKAAGFFSKEDFEIHFLKDDIVSEKEFEIYLYRAISSYKNGEGKLLISELKNRFYKHMQKSAEILDIDLIMSKKSLYTSKSLRLGNSIRASILLIFGSTFLFYKYFGVLSKTRFAITVGLALISLLVTLIISTKVKVKTDYGRQILGRVLGFKRFLETAEKNKLELLLKDNPAYFYNILPYTIVLGVSELWADKFKELVVEPPQWYGGGSGIGNVFLLSTFMRGFNRSVGALNDNMLSSPKSATNYGGGGSSVGGGSSGGGAGGGGGGSW
ncbi:MAG: DUF2207 domain-containing protein [Cetobacterium sp.]